MSEYRLIMTGVVGLCGLAVACSINPGLAQLVSTVFTVLSVVGGLGLVALLGWFVHLATTDERLPAAELLPHRVRPLPPAYSHPGNHTDKGW